MFLNIIKNAETVLITYLVIENNFNDILCGIPNSVM